MPKALGVANMIFVFGPVSSSADPIIKRFNGPPFVLDKAAAKSIVPKSKSSFKTPFHKPDEKEKAQHIAIIIIDSVGRWTIPLLLAINFIRSGGTPVAFSSSDFNPMTPPDTIKSKSIVSFPHLTFSATL